MKFLDDIKKADCEASLKRSMMHNLPLKLPQNLLLNGTEISHFTHKDKKIDATLRKPKQLLHNKNMKNFQNKLNNILSRIEKPNSDYLTQIQMLFKKLVLDEKQLIYAFNKYKYIVNLNDFSLNIYCESMLVHSMQNHKISMRIYNTLICIHNFTNNNTNGTCKLYSIFNKLELEIIGDYLCKNNISYKLIIADNTTRIICNPQNLSYMGITMHENVSQITLPIMINHVRHELTQLNTYHKKIADYCFDERSKYVFHKIKFGYKMYICIPKGFTFK